MKIDEARKRLIEAWGILGSSWGINRTMAQVHALLLIAAEPLSADEVMDELNISRGNANMSIRALIDWGLAYKHHKAGERREYFTAEKDMWKVAMSIIKERQKREIAPILQILKEVKDIDVCENEKDRAAFIEAAERLGHVVNQANAFVEFILQTEKSWIAHNLFRLFKDYLPKEDKKESQPSEKTLN